MFRIDNMSDENVPLSELCSKNFEKFGTNQENKALDDQIEKINAVFYDNCWYVGKITKVYVESVKMTFLNK